MPSYDGQDHAPNPHFLSPVPSLSPRKSPSKQNISLSSRRSTASLRGNSPMDEDIAGRHSLAHELAVALMPEPSAGSKLLAEEFGIEYDEGAEGIDDNLDGDAIILSNDVSFEDELNPSDAAMLGDASVLNGTSSLALELEGIPSDLDPSFGSPTHSPIEQIKEREQDPMVVLSQDLEYTEKFLTSLQRLDVESGPQSSQPTLEQLASNIISRINETARDREQQVRELLAYEREFRKIAAEVGGDDILGQLDELEEVDDLGDGMPGVEHAQKRLSAVLEEEPRSKLLRDWDNDNEVDYDSDQRTPIKDAFPPPPPLVGPLTPAKTIPQLSDFRTITASLVTSLTSISEQVQVNGAATTEAGRKIRALKNKLGGWRTDWDSAEHSRSKIEKWEAGLEDSDASPNGSIPSTPRSVNGRIDGRIIAEEHLRASQKALAEANRQTRTIMAAS
jgi:hypothetical protein